MIRIRNHKTGEVTELNGDHAFVELCNSDGEIAAVFYEKQNNAEMYQLDAEDEKEAKEYEDLYGVKFIKKKFIHPGAE